MMGISRPLDRLLRVRPSAASETCSEYCANRGLECAPGCRETGDLGRLEWPGGAASG
jgi:hypothetical protein